MRGALGCVFVGLLLAVAAGCSRSAPTPADGAPPASVAEGKGPKFESELVHTHTVDGKGGSGAYKGTRYEDGKPFNVVENYTTTIKGGSTTLKYEVAFVTHRDGKDVYKLTYTVAKAEGTETKTSEATYEGGRTVLVEDQYGSFVLQPPSK